MEPELICANLNTVFSALAYNAKYRVIAYAAANALLILDPYHKQSNAN